MHPARVALHVQKQSAAASCASRPAHAQGGSRQARKKQQRGQLLGGCLASAAQASPLAAPRHSPGRWFSGAGRRGHRACPGEPSARWLVQSKASPRRPLQPRSLVQQRSQRRSNGARHSPDHWFSMVVTRSTVNSMAPLAGTARMRQGVKPL